MNIYEFVRLLNDKMDYNLKGHPYVKSGIDMACWDILGKVEWIYLFILHEFIFRYWSISMIYLFPYSDPNIRVRSICSILFSWRIILLIRHILKWRHKLVVL